MAKARPTEEELPPGANRDLVLALHDLYDKAGQPGVKRISDAVRADDDLSDVVSHETVSKLLDGKAIPAWAKIRCVVTVLAKEAVGKPDVEAALDRFHELWITARRAESAESTDEPEDVLFGAGKPFESFNEGATKVRFLATHIAREAFFDVELLPGLLQVAMNVDHPLGRALVDALSADPGSSHDVVARDLVSAQAAIKLLLVTWARFEDELPEKPRQRASRMREDWGRVAQDVMEPYEKDDDTE